MSNNLNGYSDKPLSAKLGLKPGMSACFVNAPVGYEEGLIEEIKGEVHSVAPFDLVQAFVDSQQAAEDIFRIYSLRLKPSGILWLSWPKQTSGRQTDLNENALRDIGLKAGLVDVKVIAIDSTWSGLKFVYRLKDRSTAKR